MIIGKVKYYGLSEKSEYSKLKKAYVKTGDKEIHLSIENPKVTDTAIEKAKSPTLGAAHTNDIKQRYEPLVVTVPLVVLIETDT